MATKKLPTADESEQILSGILRMDRSIRRLSRLIVRQQERLRNLVSARAWRVYLSIEELSNARLVRVTDRLLRRKPLMECVMAGGAVRLHVAGHADNQDIE